MLKTPEQYFSELNFDPPDAEKISHALNSGERVFVEKYLGLDMLQDMEPAYPQPVPLPRIQQAPAARALPFLEPEIEIARPPLVISKPTGDKTALSPAPLPAIAPAETVNERPVKLAETTRIIEIAKPETATPRTMEVVSTETKIETTAASEDIQLIKDADENIAAAETVEEAEKPQAIAAETVGKDAEKTDAAVAEPFVLETAEINEAKRVIAVPARAEIKTESFAPAASTALETAVQPKMVAMRDLAMEATSVRMVSFYVGGQIFLLPVAGIHEVLRHMELIRVPQAPLFIAGAFNLRGSVIPLVHLSALLTNKRDFVYDEKSFIIVYGTENLRLGLIIDKINSMHMLETEKIIWNVESRLGEAGDFLCAIANLDDHVCGIVAPEIITQKLLSS